MRDLPPIILRIPTIFYCAALLVFAASFGLTLLEVNNTMQFAEGENPMIRAAMLRGLYQAAIEAIYIAANGVLAHILLAIWRNGRTHPERGGDA